MVLRHLLFNCFLPPLLLLLSSSSGICRTQQKQQLVLREFCIIYFQTRKAREAFREEKRTSSPRQRSNFVSWLIYNHAGSSRTYCTCRRYVWHFFTEIGIDMTNEEEEEKKEEFDQIHDQTTTKEQKKRKFVFLNAGQYSRNASSSFVMYNWDIHLLLFCLLLYKSL